MDDVLDSNAMLLKVFPDDDPTATPVNKYIDYADFAYAFNGESAGTSWVHYYSKDSSSTVCLLTTPLPNLRAWPSPEQPNSLRMISRKAWGKPSGFFLLSLHHEPTRNCHRQDTL
jgi:hypothetical protein